MNYATEIACDIVANSDIVEFGDLGTLYPSFKSKIVPQGEVFNVQKHIENRSFDSLPRKYLTLTDVTYEQTVTKPKKGSTMPTPQPNEGGGSNSDDGL